MMDTYMTGDVGSTMRLNVHFIITLDTFTPVTELLNY